jgi:farnesyl-diphosphate farnesyltransferase
MVASSHPLLKRLLKEVSRSFYLTLRVLPASVRPQIGLAYLLARTTDTIADTELVPCEVRLQALRALRERVAGRSNAALDLQVFLRHQGSPAERVLLEQQEASLHLLSQCSAADQEHIRRVVDIIAGGQELDLIRFDGATGEAPRALGSDAELDDYTYRVAGCVGEFWTRMCRAHVFPRAAVDDAFLLENGVRFGKGLQLVNILRDIKADLGNGRCYLPSSGLSLRGLSPRDLLEPSNMPRLQPLYAVWLTNARSHLRAGWKYTRLLPYSCPRIRLACAWPILLGLQTLDLLESNNPLQERVKVSRADLRKMLLRSVILYPFRPRWEKMVPV